jgi:hypothetical protein
MPTFGWVSEQVRLVSSLGKGGEHTITNDNGIDHQRQEGLLVCGGVVFQQSRGVVVADRDVGRTLSSSSADDSCNDERLEEHGRHL